MRRRIVHVAIIVRDIEQALTFYRDTLGITAGEIKEVPTEEVRIAYLPMGGPEGSEIELIEPTSANAVLYVMAVEVAFGSVSAPSPWRVTADCAAMLSPLLAQAVGVRATTAMTVARVSRRINPRSVTVGVQGARAEPTV